jgi:type II secretory pathway component PulC
MKNEDLSPEEKLLRLIRDKKKQPAPAEKAKETPADRGSVKPSVNLPVDSLTTQKILPWLDALKALQIIFLISCIFLVYAFVYPFLFFRNIKITPVTTEKKTDARVQNPTESKPFEYYLQAINDKKIFGNVNTAEIQNPTVAANPDILSQINLVGIISGANPQAVIEDKKNQKTFYVSKGQYIGQFRVSDIQEGKVILEYNGQQYEIYL